MLKSQSFTPNVLGILVNPTYLVRRALYQSIKRHSSLFYGAVLDVGCGNKPYKYLIPHTEYIGMEYDTGFGNKADVLYDGKTFPFPDARFDSVIATEVLEHVFNPDEFLSEVKRVLKPNGKVFLTCPFMWLEHQKPYDYARYSSFGLRALLERHGFKVETQEKNVTGVQAVAQIVATYIRASLPKTNPFIRILLYALCISPITILCIMLSKLLPNVSDIYIDNVIIAST